MKKINIFELLILLSYVIIYKTILSQTGSLVQYIINPSIWILISLYFYLMYSKTKKKLNDTIYTVITSSLLYIVSLYSIGMFTGYSKNPYSTQIDSIIINTFSILLVILLKEYIRDILIKNIKNRLYYIPIFVIFFLYDISFLNIIKPFNDVSDLFKRLIEDIIPIVSINLFMIYLCRISDYISASIYRIIIIIPTLIIPIYPKIDPIILTLFNVLFPFFTYLIIRTNIDKEERVRYTRFGKYYPKVWIGVFVVSIILVLFSLGAFPIKGTVILTGSMKPIINPGDVVLVQKRKFEDIKVQDIIQYKIKNYTIVHRVIKIDYYKKKIITKGDNNTNIDKPISDKQLLGVVNYKIPYIGYPTYIFRKIIGTSTESEG